MALLPILQYPDPSLTRRARPVERFDAELRQLAADMGETMYAAPGVGLAAPQVGRSLRLLVVDISPDKDHLQVFVNPVAEPLGDELRECEEGCLSLPGIYEQVTRPARVLVRAQDLSGEPFAVECDGLLSVCVQHEIDHLDGVVFVDHLSRLKKSRAVARLAKLRREKARQAETDS